MVALSCMDNKEVVRMPNLTTWSFIPTPPIPTYIFTVAAGRLRSVCNSSALHGKEICIWRFTHWTNWELMAQNIIQAIARFQVTFNYLILHFCLGTTH
jgi:aminopeptidase N